MAAFAVASAPIAYLRSHASTPEEMKRDAAGFAAIFADDATFTGPDGAVQTKAQLVADVKSGASIQ